MFGQIYLRIYLDLEAKKMLYVISCRPFGSVIHYECNQMFKINHNKFPSPSNNSYSFTVRVTFAPCFQSPRKNPCQTAFWCLSNQQIQSLCAQVWIVPLHYWLSSQAMTQYMQCCEGCYGSLHKADAFGFPDMQVAGGSLGIGQPGLWVFSCFTKHQDNFQLYCESPGPCLYYFTAAPDV